MAEANRKLPVLTHQQLTRFHGHVDRRGPDECWPWKRALLKGGYGGFKLRGQMLRANRVAYFIGTGNDPGEMMVCHSCDSPQCCNPAHLFLGTNQANIIDAKNKGRLAPRAGNLNNAVIHRECIKRGDEHWSRQPDAPTAKGEKNGATKLTEEIVREIRREHAAGTATYCSIARRLGCARETIRCAITRRNWKHITT